ncbi:MAG TPA: energy transducer TonB [Terriglobia bacterium]|nr:energy transducer TonB [Terriglobia bacterium]
MNKLMTLTILFVSLSSTFSGSGSHCAIGVRKLTMPDYPNVARLAQISGDVHLMASITSDGHVEAVNVVDRAPILAKYARRNLLSWAFTCQPNGRKLQVVYHYRLQGRKIYGIVVPTVSLETPNEILIVSNPPLPMPDQG